MSKAKILSLCSLLGLTFGASSTFAQAEPHLQPLTDSEEAKALLTSLRLALNDKRKPLTGAEAGLKANQCSPAQQKALYDAFRTRNFTEALKQAHSLNKNASSQALSAIIEGYCLLHNRKFSQAITDLNAAIKGGQINLPAEIASYSATNAYSMRAYCYAMQGKNNEAVTDLERVLAAKPMKFSELNVQMSDMENLKKILIKQGNSARAKQVDDQRRNSDELFHFVSQKPCRYEFAPVLLKELRTTPKENAGNSIRLATIAKLQLDLGDFKGALDTVNQALAIEPDSINIHLVRLMVYDRTNELEPAIKDAKYVESTLEYQAGSSMVGVGNYLTYTASLAARLKRAGKFDEALVYMKKIVDKGMGGEETYSDMGDCYLALNKTDKAVQAYTDGLNYAVDTKSLLYRSRARAYRKLGDTKHAEEDEAQAKRLDDKAKNRSVL